MRYQFADKTWDSKRVFDALVKHYKLTEVSSDEVVLRVIEHAWNAYYGQGRAHCDTSRETMRACAEEYRTQSILPFFVNREVLDLCTQGKLSPHELEPPLTHAA
jgi:hypothetical protein